MRNIEIQRLQANTDIREGFSGKVVHTDRSTIVFWNIDNGSHLPFHSHDHEQTMIVQEGVFHLVVDGHEEFLSAGTLRAIKSDAVHGGMAMTNCQIIEIFSPVREDFAPSLIV